MNYMLTICMLLTTHFISFLKVESPVIVYIFLLCLCYLKVANLRIVLVFFFFFCVMVVDVGALLWN